MQFCTIDEISHILASSTNDNDNNKIGLKHIKHCGNASCKMLAKNKQIDAFYMFIDTDTDECNNTLCKYCYDNNYVYCVDVNDIKHNNDAIKFCESGVCDQYKEHIENEIMQYYISKNNNIELNYNIYEYNDIYGINLPYCLLIN